MYYVQSIIARCDLRVLELGLCDHADSGIWSGPSSSMYKPHCSHSERRLGGITCLSLTGWLFTIVFTYVGFACMVTGRITLCRHCFLLHDYIVSCNSGLSLTSAWQFRCWLLIDSALINVSRSADTHMASGLAGQLSHMMHVICPPGDFDVCRDFLGS